LHKPSEGVANLQKVGLLPVAADQRVFNYRRVPERASPQIERNFGFCNIFQVSLLLNK